jgi:hypothetical protein
VKICYVFGMNPHGLGLFLYLYFRLLLEIKGLRAFLVPSLLGRHAKCLEKINNFGANPKGFQYLRKISLMRKQKMGGKLKKLIRYTCKI